MRLGVVRTSSIFVLATLLVLVTMEATTGESPLLRQGERKLHVTNFPHNHRWPVATVVPSSLNSEYYTDDLAINDNMIRDKKDLYDREIKNQGTTDESQTSVIAALAGSQSSSSSAANKGLWARGIQVILVGSWLFW